MALSIGNGKTYNGGDSLTLTAGDADTITLTGGYESLTAHDRDVITIWGGSNTVTQHDNGSLTIYGGGNSITLHDSDTLTINDTRSGADYSVGSYGFGDAVSAHINDTIALNYTLNLGSTATADVSWNVRLTENNISGTIGQVISGDIATLSIVVNAGAKDKINFSGSNGSVLLNLGSGDTLTTTGSNDTITIGGSAATKSSVTIGATAAGTTINGGLGVDTFTAGSGYDGGNHYIGSARGYADGFNAIGSCANYSSLACRVTVNFDTNVGQGFDANGALMWTDTYTNIQQLKAGTLDGNVLTASSSYYTEIKGGLGQTTFTGGAAGDRIIWSSAGKNGLLDGQATDVATGGTGTDEFYWRNSKGTSNFGETINGFSLAQGDDLNLSEFASSGFAGVDKAFTFDNLTNWASASSNGVDTTIWFDRTGSGNFGQAAAVLKNVDLFQAYGVADHSTAGSQQVVLNMYNNGALVFDKTH